MGKFVKRPIEIEAFQMTKERRWDNSEWPNWLHKAWQMEPSEGALWCDYDNADKKESEAKNTPLKKERLFLGTLEGVYKIQWNDWIIQGIKGELYPCKPDIFEATYDAIAETV